MRSPLSPRLASIRHAAPRLLLCVGAFVLAARTRAQVDPLIQPYRTLQSQQVKPNVLILADSKGTFGLDMAGRPPASGGEGVSAMYICQASTACPVGSPYQWVYFGPSRVAIVKNVLGPYLDLLDEPTSASSACTASTTCVGVTAPSLSTIKAKHLIDDFASKINIGLLTFDNSESGFVRNQIIVNTTSGAGACETDMTDRIMQPLSVPATSNATTQCSPSVNIAALDTQWSTPTYAALRYSQYYHKGVELGGSQSDPTDLICPSGSAAIKPVFPETPVYPPPKPASLPADPYQVCGRKLFNMLITDGVASYCNNPPLPGTPDGIISSYPACVAGAAGKNVSQTTAPFKGAPMEAADKAYNRGITANGFFSARTFVLAISNAFTGVTAAQEVRYDGYFGKTDARDPYGQGGIKLMRAYDNLGNKLCLNSSNAIGVCGTTFTLSYYYPADPYLRMTGKTGATCTCKPGVSPCTAGIDASCGEYVLADNINVLPGSTDASSILFLTPSAGLQISSGTGFVCSHEYAYTATNQAQLVAGLQAAFSAVAAGDYTTEAPVIADNTPTPLGALSIIYTTSADYPGFAGHLRAQDLDLPLAGGGFQVIWDAGQKLATRDPATRNIYTISGGVQVKITNTSILPGISPGGVNFLLGYDGSMGTLVGNRRPWMLGDMTGSPPIAVMPPRAFLQGTTIGHDLYQTAKYSRTRLILVGSSDGMVHAFNAGTGDEEWAFVPPVLLPVIDQLYQNFKLLQIPVGQPAFAENHIYGVSAPLNVADVDFNNAISPATPDWRTIVVGGLGPGGKALFALDVTADVSPPTPASPPNPRFKVLWYKDATAFPSLGDTWSSPSIALATNGKWVVSAGSGPNGVIGNSGYAKGVTVYHLKPNDGTVLQSYVLGTSGSDSTALISSTTVSAHSDYSTSKISFADALANRGYQADTAGRIWDTDTSAVTPSSWSPVQAFYLATSAAELQQPIYHSPSLGLYQDTYSPGTYANHFLQIMSWASGTFSESRPQVNDLNCGPSPKIPCFSANLYSRMCDLTATPAAGCAGGFTTRQTTLTGQTYKIGTVATSYSKFARTIGPSLLFIPVVFNASGSAVTTWPKAGDIGSLFTVYDPKPTDAAGNPVLSCKGESSVIFNYPFGKGTVAARDSTGAYAASSTTVIDAGAGSSSPAIVYNGRIFINMSSETQAGGIEIGTTPTTTTAPYPVVSSWREVF